MASPQNTPEVDDTDTESSASDSGYSDAACSTESVTPSVYAFEERHGRTYHAYHAGKYMLPNDEGEQKRLDLQYHALRAVIGDRITYAPIVNPNGILDIGTGTGIWAINAADAYPEALVIGTDLSPIQPRWVPPNLQFEVSDMDEPWAFSPERFDLIHTRIMHGFGVSSWPDFYRQAFLCLSPGGWVENQEIDFQFRSDDDSLPQNSFMVEWARLWNHACEIRGETARCDPYRLKAQMEEEGFINTHIVSSKMPIGPWAMDPMLKQAGSWSHEALYTGVYGMSVALFKETLGWNETQLNHFLEGFRQELTRESIHAYWTTYIVLGQKPP
ncbi:hypothetical protein HRR83_000622 [Exophiala dermatitidis]|uniref:S-adenosyl-L-methionine-dependent methyltransferase n=1 Tax=Exophiala dermatitidis TaxID=5970 RepID=A0AAN6F5H9_EXODE|nr:hypothetical protein HRR74_000625 [Exophiala dermatitidis]KAJ4528504.1 hypothetical protein HRR73_001127 [Exophiala dermatitidis]KAJ4529874.1 hypothetical protein HRR76_009123 [Exophiala dermatitidis]KAJ4558634.1 hypothetical protein HRR77_000622 [Exophiala dermatitidis]KAJ4581334.1 hypothetical protein HRR79_000375 [Exophiala dermatitidis]